jgi:signal recognition particle subunit SRP54
MFDQFQKRLSSAMQKVRGKSTIDESDVTAVLGEIRTGLLEADVHFRVTKDFLARVKERCLREDVIKSLSPAEQILKVLNDELTQILGGQNKELDLSAKAPVALLMCGLQGSGKTTSSVKLALHLKNKGKRVAVVSVDTQRPAAMEQLRQLAEKNGVSVLSYEAKIGAPKITKLAMADASDQNFEVLIVDTAGRLQVDEVLMKELKEVEQISQATEKLLVIDAMMGQQAVDVAQGFSKELELTGAILSKLDGDSRGGAALSFVSVTGKPLKFIGTGERAQDFEVFHPDRIASRLLDMGDVLSLIEKAESVISEDDAQKAAEKMKDMGSFNLEDFRDQLKMMSKMGPLSGLLKMIPGMGGLKEQLEQVDTEGELKRVNAIINSMTVYERRNPDQLNGSRRLRIAKGCGNEVSEVNALVKRFLEARKMMKKMGKFGGFGGGGGGGGNPFGGGGTPGGGFRGKPGKGFGRKL